jgi:para-aminobenzoate synthetase component 1
LFLDSALPHAALGRYSYITADPFAFVRSRGQRVEYSGNLAAVHPATRANPFEVLQTCLERFRAATVAGLPPFQGGVAGLFGYDLCHHLERLPRPHYDEFAAPDLAVGFYDWVFAYDHVAERGWLISTGFPETDPVRRRERAGKRLQWARALIAGRDLPTGSRDSRTPTRQSKIVLAPQWSLPQLPGLTSNFSSAAFLAAIRRAIDYVHAGDCFQVNIAQRLLYPCREHPAALYHRLRRQNPAPFGGYFDLGDFVIASASPERFLRLDSTGVVETRPIKGTRPRGQSPDQDRQYAEELLSSPKDRAENIMIVDLLRNDLGRVCEYGTIQVPDLCRVESYQTVHHLVSLVRGRLRQGKGAIDLLRAAFPGGSVTGAPKIRAMEIIAELEPTARGAYCGCLGYLGFDGSMDTNILIRTFTIGKGWVQFPVGGGIVADSDPEREYEETLHKAEGMLRALR